jgi:hypothetical protein
MLMVADLIYKDIKVNDPQNQPQRRAKSQLKERAVAHKPTEKALSHAPSAKTNLHKAATVHHASSCPNRLIHDPLAKKSDKRISSRLSQGDGDVWMEKECVNVKTGKHVSVFYSAHTGRKVPHEPPSGATKVLYLTSQSMEICPGCYQLYKLEREVYRSRSHSPVKRTKL